MPNDPTTEPPSKSDAKPAIGPMLPSESTLNFDGPPKTRAGWYPTPDGHQRYWDGSSWTHLSWQQGEAVAAAASLGRAPQPKWSPRRRKALLIAGAVVIIIGGLLVGGFGVKGASDRQVAAATVAKIQTVERLAAAEAKASADAKRVKDDAERTSRASTVTEIEASVKTMAEKDVANKLLDGPIMAGKCSPIGAGSTNDLTQLTTVFECFAANKDNGDGSQSGYTFHANMNWSDGTYTYGLGKANG